MQRFFGGLKPVRLGPLGFVRPDLLALGAIGLAVLVAGGAVALLLTQGGSAPKARLVASDLQSVKLAEPVLVKFDRPVDLSRTRVKISPDVKLDLLRLKSELVVRPATHWDVKQRYQLRLGDVPDAEHHGVLKGFSSGFTTQPLVGVVDFTVDGLPAGATVTSDTQPVIAATFAEPMKTSSVQFLLNQQRLGVTNVAWNPAGTLATISLPSRLLPYHAYVLDVPQTGSDRKGNPMTAPASLALKPMGLLPSNTGTGIGPGFKNPIPLLIVIDNAPGSVPSYGLQNADMVFEYLSEYGITRMTGVFFNKVSPTLRSVRSCRMINLYLDYGLDGLHMCSGTSAGTYSWFMGAHGNPIAPGAINDVDRGNHFFRCGADDPPHNLCVSAATAYRLRAQYQGHLPFPSYLVDPAHPDSGLGTPAGPPSIGQQCVSYTYDQRSQAYLRYDHGSPYIDAGTGLQIQVKNVVLMHVNEHFAGWIEDENGGAGSVWYEMIGSGPAQIYSDGKLISGTWHMGDDLPINKNNYWQNHEAPYFTDSSGNLVELNTGLTWIHVIGNQGLNAGC